MSLPSTGQQQMSIKSFFPPRQQPNYAPPPNQLPKGQAQIENRPPPPVIEQPPPPAPSVEIEPIPNSPPPAVSPHPQATIRPIVEKDIQPLRRINALLLPVSYPDVFYQKILDPEVSGRFSRAILWADANSSLSTAPMVVGGVVCRVDPVVYPSGMKPVVEEHALYIQSLCLLSPYRSFGLVTATLDNIMAAAVADTRLNVRYVYAHVWTENEEGLRWYQARGFVRDGKPLEGYYTKLRPGSAWIVRRALVLPAIRGSLGLVSPFTAQAAAPTTLDAVTAVVGLHPGTTLSPLANGAAAALSPAGTGSYQNRRAATEWNDLPADMAPGALGPPRSNGGSGASSRSSSTARRKKDRAYPAAAFGS